jgi:putative glutamine amidotransferase
LEMELIGAAHARGLPILAICRGAQLLNVAAGGTLIPHVDGHRPQEGDDEDMVHAVKLESGSMLARLASAERSTVNSSHHQVIDRIAPSFRVTATAHDGAVEGYEWRNPAGKPFLLAVQWHPERMDTEHGLGGGALAAFLSAMAS